MAFDAVFKVREDPRAPGPPIIDSDGHTVELTPVYLDYLKQAGGPDIVDRYVKATAARGTNRWHDMTEDERRRDWTRCPPWWARPTRTLDRATASLPRLLHERMEELGLDYAVLYPTEGMGGPRCSATRSCAGCRAGLSTPFMPTSIATTPTA